MPGYNHFAQPISPAPVTEYQPHSWCEGPIILPAGWESIQTERIWVRGRPARLVANHGDQQAQIEFLDD